MIPIGLQRVVYATKDTGGALTEVSKILARVLPRRHQHLPSLALPALDMLIRKLRSQSHNCNSQVFSCFLHSSHYTWGIARDTRPRTADLILRWGEALLACQGAVGPWFCHKDECSRFIHESSAVARSKQVSSFTFSPLSFGIWADTKLKKTPFLKHIWNSISRYWSIMLQLDISSYYPTLQTGYGLLTQDRQC